MGGWGGVRLREGGEAEFWYHSDYSSLAVPSQFYSFWLKSSLVVIIITWIGFTQLILILSVHIITMRKKTVDASFS